MPTLLFVSALDFFRRRGLLLCALFALLCLLPAQARADTLTLADIEHGTLLLQTGQPGEYRALASQSSRVRIRVTGPVARATVTQRFSNPGDTWLEALYAFPLPEDAAVDQLRLRIGDRIIEGEIQEKQAARRTYETARAAGQRTALVEQRRPNLFTTAVANIPPGGEVTVEIEYQQKLHWRDQSFSLRFPMAMTPRFTPGAVTHQATLADGWGLLPGELPQRVEPARKADGSPRNPVDLEVQLAPGFELDTVESRYHRVETDQPEAGGPLRIRLAAEDHAADRDFLLRWTAAPGAQPQAAFFTEQTPQGVYGLLMLMPPAQDAAGHGRTRREVSFIIDVSGSMAGPRLRAAQEALALAVDTLTAEDHFNIIVFNHEAGMLWPQPRPADAANRDIARREIDRLRATGGTVMLPALALAIGQQRSDAGALQQIVFITDGAVGNEREVQQYIERHIGGARLFTVGIGQAPNTHFMTEAARAGRGSFTLIADTREVSERMRELFARIEAPALTDLLLELSVEADIQPDPIPDLYRGEPLAVVMKLDGMPHHARLQGKLGRQDWAFELNLHSAGDAAGLSGLWAREKIAHWTRAGWRGADADTVREEILQLALDHHLVSAYTSLVAVDRTPVRPADAELDAQALPATRPGDMGGYDDALVMAQAGTASQLMLMIGAMLLLLALLLLRRRETA